MRHKRGWSMLVEEVRVTGASCPKPMHHIASA